MGFVTGFAGGVGLFRFDTETTTPAGRMDWLGGGHLY